MIPVKLMEYVYLKVLLPRAVLVTDTSAIGHSEDNDPFLHSMSVGTNRQPHLQQIPASFFLLFWKAKNLCTPCDGAIFLIHF